MRRAASLRSSRNGRIGFKPPYSKRGTAAKGPHGFILGGIFPSYVQIGFNQAIPFLEDRNESAFMRALPQRVAFLSIFEIGYCALGRGGAERSECPP